MNITFKTDSGEKIKLKNVILTNIDSFQETDMEPKSITFTISYSFDSTGYDDFVRNIVHNL